MPTLLAGMVLFFAAHSLAIGAPSLRAGLIARLGAGGYKGVSALVSLVGLWLIVRGFGAARPDSTVLYDPPTWMRHVVLALMLPVLPLLVAAQLKGHIRARLKHPMLVAVKLWAVAHLLANGKLADLVLFGGFLAWAVIDRISLKRRPDTRPPVSAPSVLHDAIAVVAGIVLYVLLVTGWHLRLFGVSPLG